MSQDRLDGLLLVIPLLVAIYLLMVIDRRFFNNVLMRLFSKRWFRIVLAAVIITITLLFFNGQHKGLLFLI